MSHYIVCSRIKDIDGRRLLADLEKNGVIFFVVTICAEFKIPWINAMTWPNSSSRHIFTTLK